MNKALVLVAALAVGCGGANKGETDPDGLTEPGEIDEVGGPEALVDPGQPAGPGLPGDEVVGPVDPENPDGEPTKPEDDGKPDGIYEGTDENGMHGRGWPVCFCIEDEKNISQIFIDFGDCDDVGRFEVFARTPFYEGFEEFTDDLKDQGGSCGKELSRDYWFTLPGPDRDAPQEIHEAEVCVLLHKKHLVRVGYHAGDTCALASRDAPDKSGSCGGSDDFIR